MPNEILTRAIDAVASGNHLTADHTAAVLSEIMEGRASEVQTGAFLIALRTKGETVPELVGLARTMRELATPVLLHTELQKGTNDLISGNGKPVGNFFDPFMTLTRNASISDRFGAMSLLPIPVSFLPALRGGDQV